MRPQLLLPLLSGCILVDFGTPEHPWDTGDTADRCPQVESVWPAEGATDAFYRTAIEIRFDDGAPAAVTVQGPDGEVTGAATRDDDVTWFVPDAPLRPESAYQVYVSTECDRFSWEFTTSSAGLPVDQAVLDGGTWAVDIGSGRVIEPAGVGGLIQPYMDDEVTYLVGLTAGEAAPALTGSEGTPDGVQECTSPMDLPVGHWDDGWFTTLPTDAVQLGTAFNLQGLTLSGAFTPDGARIEGVTLDGLWDTRLVVLDGVEGEDLCDLLPSLGLECVPCADGFRECVPLRVTDLHATRLDAGLLSVDELCALDRCADAAMCTPEAE